jgi:hypothetical protein
MTHHEVMMSAFADELNKIGAVQPAKVLRGIAPPVPANAPKLGPAASAAFDALKIKKLPT